VTEPIAPDRAAPHFAAHISLPEPIGLVCDVQAGLDRLLARLCARLAEAGHGACEVLLQAGRMDGTSTTARLRLARPLGDAGTLARLFAPQIDMLEAGFGFDSLRLVALATEPMHPQQISPDMDAPQSTLAAHAEGDRLADTMTRLGNRLGFEALYRLAPAQSHIPERAFLKTAAAWSDAADWGYTNCGQTDGGPTGGGPTGGGPTGGGQTGADTGTSMVFGHDTKTGTEDASVQTSTHRTGHTIAPPRPLVLFPPEPITAPPAPRPPHRFRWRGMALRTRAAHGPERIAPEWWFDDPAWRTGLRDYWRVETDQGRRLWLFHTPQSPGWAVQGEFA
jgi:protein ImuB